MVFKNRIVPERTITFLYDYNITIKIDKSPKILSIQKILLTQINRHIFGWARLVYYSDVIVWFEVSYTTRTAVGLGEPGEPKTVAKEEINATLGVSYNSPVL